MQVASLDFRNMNETSKYYFWPTDDGFTMTKVYQHGNDWYWDMFLPMQYGILRLSHKPGGSEVDCEARGHMPMPEEVATRILKRFDETIDFFTSCFNTQRTGRKKQEADRVFYYIERGKIILLRTMRNGKIYKLEYDHNHVIYRHLSDPYMLEYRVLYYFDPTLADEMVRAYRQLRKYFNEEKQTFLFPCPF